MTRRPAPNYDHFTYEQERALERRQNSSAAMARLRADHRVQEVENAGMEVGRWMVSLHLGYGIGEGYDRTSSFSCQGPVDGLRRMADVDADEA
jgi:hypothetical protein